MKLNSTELNKLLDQVSEDVAGILAKAEEDEKSPMAKASPGEEAPGETTPAGSSTEGSAPEASPEGSPSEGPEGSAGDAASEASAPEGSEQTQNPATDESAGPEALTAEYAKLPIEELKMHVMAAHQALMQAIGGDGGGQDPSMGQPDGAPAGGPAPEATPPAGPPPEATPEQPPMGKKEFKANESNGGKIMKSQIELRLETLEKSLADKDATIADLETKFGKAAEGLQKLIEKSNNVALRKSISGISFDKKPGEVGKEEVVLSKSEAIAKCNALSTKSDLKKSDRDAIMAFVIGSAPQSTISHLLK